MAEEGVTIEQDREETNSTDDPTRDPVSPHRTPEELYQKYSKWNQFKRGHQPLSAFGVPATMLSPIAIMASDFDPAVSLAVAGANAPWLYGHRNVRKANVEKSDIRSELDNWYLFEEDYDFTDLFEEADPLEEITSEQMLNSYQKILADLEDIENEISELTDTDIANENFSEDYNHGIQAVKIEEDTDFGGYNFQVNVYLEDEQLGVYEGRTDNEEIIQEIESEGINALEGRDMLSEHFDLEDPLGLRWTTPEPL